ncbi:crossover junction endonuclease MUS81 [Aspergillus alliaceus]|uniref:crossover junction endonuclease MUS81 n=1 Tax=Petromyces alliaceus TaxID=209559 RepID=UPI0012A757CB|nr:ERCC4 domain-containing protein [Aspergillus alliaceus]KAB8230516.1 ERCC4 domain-containing protein [Aspergillus alliaceus]
MSETCANPLLLGWIKEWLDQAKEHNSKGVTVYKKAYESMKACPLVFQHPSEAQQLNGLGPKLCDRLTDKLKSHCAENGLPMPEYPNSTVTNGKRLSGEGVSEGQPAKKPRKARPYVPALRSGPYAILLGLSTLDENSSQSLTKAQLIDRAQPYCDSSFTAPSDPGKFFTAWSSMKTLLQKDLVYDHGHPLKKYALTEEGWEVAKRVKKTLPENQNTLSFGNQMDTSGAPQASRASTADPQVLPQESNENLEATLNPQMNRGNGPEDTTVTPIVLPPNSFTIQLVLDTREVRTSKDRDYISNELSKKGITTQVRALELGDAMWVAKFHDPKFLSQYGEEGDEVMLDYIVERKRLDDLIGSIKDGRFHEQKFRLRRSGMKNVIYLIEEFSLAYDANTPAALKYQEMVASAIASTQVVNGYFVKKTKNLDDTIRYLARMTFLLRKMYTQDTAPDSPDTPPSHTLSLIPSRQLSSSQSYLNTLVHFRAENPSITYAVTSSTFAALASKSESLSLRDVFLKMLMCTRGVTGDKALEIQRRWPTPQAFIKAFEALDAKGRETLVSDQLSSAVGRKKVAKVLSKKIAEVWGEDG